MTHNQKVGKFGEDLAKNFLIKNGYKILGTNIKTGHKELDIIATHKDTLVFVEVKTRTSDKFGEADEALNFFKTNNIKRAAELYLIYNKTDNSDIRIDLIAVDIKKGENTAKIRHFQGVV